MDAGSSGFVSARSEDDGRLAGVCEKAVELRHVTVSDERAERSQAEQMLNVGEVSDQVLGESRRYKHRSSSGCSGI